jgi:hypothetical protein
VEADIIPLARYVGVVFKGKAEPCRDLFCRPKDLIRLEILAREFGRLLDPTILSQRESSLFQRPSSKFQAPTSRETPSSNFEKDSAHCFGGWLLELPWSLDVEVWCFAPKTFAAVVTLV